MIVKVLSTASPPPINMMASLYYWVSLRPKVLVWGSIKDSLQSVFSSWRVSRDSWVRLSTAANPVFIGILMSSSPMMSMDEQVITLDEREHVIGRLMIFVPSTEYLVMDTKEPLWHRTSKTCGSSTVTKNFSWRKFLSLDCSHNPSLRWWCTIIELWSMMVRVFKIFMFVHSLVSSSRGIIRDDIMVVPAVSILTSSSWAAFKPP